MSERQVPKLPRRHNLVIARVGDSSLHPNWLNGSGEERNWDLIVNYFGSDPDKYRGGDWLRIDSEGLKFPALYELIHGQEQLIRQYDYIWLPDEDLLCGCQDINRLFDICRREDLDLAQPALTHDSYFSHPITLHNSSFRLRRTTFVEIMAPCFSSDALWHLLPTMNENVSGWGLDHIWPVLLGEDSSVAILDEIPIRHTRPVGAGQYYKAVAELGKDAWKERDELLRLYGAVRQRYSVRSAITTSGSRLPDGFRLLFRYGWGLLTSARRLKIGWWYFPRLWMSAMFQQVKGGALAGPYWGADAPPAAPLHVDPKHDSL